MDGGLEASDWTGGGTTGRMAAGASGGAELIEEVGGGEMAGDLTRGGAAHAVADDEGAGLRATGADVLIVAAGAADVGEHGVDELGNGHGAEKMSQKRTVHGRAGFDDG